MPRMTARAPSLLGTLRALVASPLATAPEHVRRFPGLDSCWIPMLYFLASL